MASSNLSSFNSSSIPSAAGMRFGIVVSEWNSEITSSLRRGVIETLLNSGCKESDLLTYYVPGSFELPMGAKWILESGTPDAVICLGCVIEGETRHFEFICQAVTIGIMQVQLDHSVPVIFGVLTTRDQQQAIDRSGGKLGNKGVEAAITAIKMVALRRDI